MKTPSIPMSPSDLPQQRVVEVVDLPPCPNEIDVCLYTKYKRQMPRKPSRNVKYLCQVEWAWSPMHNRISCYYMHKGRSCWILWERSYDNDCGRWLWTVAASVPHKSCTEYQAATHLLRAIWQWEYEDCELDQPHWVNDIDLLSMADLAAIARAVWS
jgi:hypothetical protein